MRGLRARVEALEGQAVNRSGGWWHTVFVETTPGTDQTELDHRLAEIRKRALEAGWTPESGRPDVVIVELTAEE